MRAKRRLGRMTYHKLRAGIDEPHGAPSPWAA
jgi:hypothetical protein